LKEYATEKPDLLDQTASQQQSPSQSHSPAQSFSHSQNQPLPQLQSQNQNQNQSHYLGQSHNPATPKSTQIDDPYMKWHAGKLVKEDGGVRFMDSYLLGTVYDEVCILHIWKLRR